MACRAAAGGGGDAVRTRLPCRLHGSSVLAGMLELVGRVEAQGERFGGGVADAQGERNGGGGGAGAWGASRPTHPPTPLPAALLCTQATALSSLLPPTPLACCSARRWCCRLSSCSSSSGQAGRAGACSGSQRGLDARRTPAPPPTLSQFSAASTFRALTPSPSTHVPATRSLAPFKHTHTLYSSARPLPLTLCSINQINQSQSPHPSLSAGRPPAASCAPAARRRPRAPPPPQQQRVGRPQTRRPPLPAEPPAPLHA